LWGPLRSVEPPISVPAWSCMLSGYTPGDLGIYGFRNRWGRNYEELKLATSRSVAVPRLWDLVGATGGRTVTLGVPGTYPPSPVNGCLVSCFLAPSTKATYTFPRGLQDELQALTGGYVLDVSDFRSEDKSGVAQRIFDMTEQRFAVARHFATSKDWRLFTFVDMGPDRLHHGFWKHCEPSHPRHDPLNPYRDLFRDYYRALDRHLGEFLAVLPEGTTVLVVSDHGAQSMRGGFRINQWLVEQGLLTLTRRPAYGERLNLTEVDWDRTIAWAHGGYYARIHLNVRDREPRGTVPSTHYAAVRDAVARSLEAIVDERGASLGTRALRPEDLYPTVRGTAPDLLVYLGDLQWRALETFDPDGGLYSFENDTGSDDANHAPEGVLMLADEALPTGFKPGMSIYDVTPTLCRLLELPPQGRYPERGLADAGRL
jgi:predicted AlkP superfamily phosphohydrolase/phosphomutase